MAATTTAHPDHYTVGVVVDGDVIEWDGQPWRVVSGKSTAVLRTLALKHANLPNRTRTVRPRKDAQVRMLAPRAGSWW